MRRPQFYLWQDWVVARTNDELHAAIGQDLGRWELQATFTAKDEPTIEIYRRR